MTDAGTDCVPSPQPRTRKKGGKGDKEREREGTKPDLFTHGAF